ncbi:ASPIC/UnbV domain-containing protein [Mucilaginibacter metallidurans]|uniref:ASPIC/UnbV domain-containing protein n=1 Tax=Mucilaginibacter sp. P4 TaxID=3383180 RepID=UPI00389A1D77
MGKIKEIDSIVVKWPCGKQKVLKGVKPNQTITVKEAESGLPGKAVRGQPVQSRCLSRVEITMG